MIIKEELIERFKREFDKGIDFDDYDLGEDVGVWYNSISPPSWSVLQQGSFTEQFYFKELDMHISIDAYRDHYNGTTYDKETIR